MRAALLLGTLWISWRGLRDGNVLLTLLVFLEKERTGVDGGDDNVHEKEKEKKDENGKDHRDDGTAESEEATPTLEPITTTLSTPPPTPSTSDNMEKEKEEDKEKEKDAPVLSVSDAGARGRSMSSVHQVQSFVDRLCEVSAKYGGVVPSSVTPRALLSGNLKAVADAVWALLYVFWLTPLTVTSDENGLDVLVSWARGSVSVMLGNVDIEDACSFSDGRYLCALAQAHDALCVNAEALPPYRREQNLQQAVDLLHRRFAVPMALDVRDTVDAADEGAMLVYLALCYRRFSVW